MTSTATVSAPAGPPPPDAADERLRRWRLVLGGEAGEDGTGRVLSGRDADVDRALETLYGAGAGAEGGN
ncbi:hypothetical protein ACSNOK_09900, partial [Streptomyces sp. URMC 126]